jgi:hypothetical protein
MSSRHRDMPPSRAIAGAEPMTKAASRRMAGIEDGVAWAAVAMPGSQLITPSVMKTIESRPQPKTPHCSTGTLRILWRGYVSRQFII